MEAAFFEVLLVLVVRLGVGSRDPRPRLLLAGWTGFEEAGFLSAEAAILLERLNHQPTVQEVPAPSLEAASLLVERSPRGEGERRASSCTDTEGPKKYGLHRCRHVELTLLVRREQIGGVITASDDPASAAVLHNVNVRKSRATSFNPSAS